MYLSSNGLKFILVLWLCSRVLIVIAMQLIAPSISSANHLAWGWDAMSRWDGVWYQQIATSGYEYVNRTMKCTAGKLAPILNLS
jgi:hypothetical protein